MSSLNILNGNKNLICCFGGMLMKMGGILPFEFVKYLSSVYSTEYDLMFFVDKNQCCYHRGIQPLSNDIDSTVEYLNGCIKDYATVIFMGVSAGGYASILFGSLCRGVTAVISFIPKTKLDNPVNKKYANLKNVINKSTNYILFGDMSITDVNDCHHILQCEMLEDFSNVNVLRYSSINLKILRDTGVIKNAIDSVLLTAR